MRIEPGDNSQMKHAIVYFGHYDRNCDALQPRSHEYKDRKQMERDVAETHARGDVRWSSSWGRTSASRLPIGTRSTASSSASTACALPSEFSVPFVSGWLRDNRRRVRRGGRGLRS